MDYATEFYINDTINDLNKFINDIRMNPRSNSSGMDAVTQADIDRLIEKIQKIQATDGNVKVQIDKKDLFTIQNTMVGWRWFINGPIDRITSV